MVAVLKSVRCDLRDKDQHLLFFARCATEFDEAVIDANPFPPYACNLSILCPCDLGALDDSTARDFASLPLEVEYFPCAAASVQKHAIGDFVEFGVSEINPFARFFGFRLGGDVDDGDWWVVHWFNMCEF